MGINPILVAVLRLDEIGSSPEGLLGDFTKVLVKKKPMEGVHRLFLRYSIVLRFGSCTHFLLLNSVFSCNALTSKNRVIEERSGNLLRVEVDICERPFRASSVKTYCPTFPLEWYGSIFSIATSFRRNGSIFCYYHTTKSINLFLKIFLQLCKRLSGQKKRFARCIINVCLARNNKAGHNILPEKQLFLPQTL